MKSLYRKITLHLLILGLSCSVSNAFAGNEDRAGSAGGSHLLINPWARSGGLAGSNIASSSPIESMFLNVAGLAFVEKTEIQVSNVNWLSGAGVSINSLGFGQQLGGGSVIGFRVTAIGFGDIMRTTTELPEGNNSFFSPSTVNIGLSYAKEFSNSIYGGLTVNVLSESIADVRSSGVAFDAGIRYVTGEFDQVKLGITLKNVGPPITMRGDGLSFETRPPGDNAYNYTAQNRADSYELPSLVAIGGTYDFALAESHTLSPSATFVANSFTSDQYILGLEYNFKDLVYLRGGYDFRRTELEENSTRDSALQGFSAGASLDIPFNEGKNRIGFDYAYRVTNPFNGVHYIGVILSIGGDGGE